MNGAEHHREAERLLSEARKEQDSIRRSQILAEAQVHATLALGAPAKISPASPGQAQAADTESTGVADSHMPEGSGPVRAGLFSPYGGRLPHWWPADPTSPLSAYTRITGHGQQIEPRRDPAPAPPPNPVTPLPSPESVTDEPWEQMTLAEWARRPARPLALPDDLDEQEPDDLDEQEPGGPEKPEPGGGFSPIA